MFENQYDEKYFEEKRKKNLRGAKKVVSLQPQNTRKKSCLTKLKKPM